MEKMPISAKEESSAQEGNALDSNAFFSRVIQRSALNRFMEVLNSDDKSGCVKLVSGEKLNTIGHVVDGLKIKDVFGSPDKAESQASKWLIESAQEKLNTCLDAKDLVDEIASSSENGDGANLDKALDLFRRAALELFEHLEKMIPSSLRKKYIENEISLREKYLNEKSDTQDGRVARQIEDLKAAKERLDSDRSL